MLATGVSSAATRKSPLGALLGKWFAGQPNDLECAKDPARILAVDFFESDRVVPFQFLQQLRQRRVFQLCPQGGIGWRRVSEAFEENFEIKSGAAAEDRHATARLDFIHRQSSQLNEPGGVERLGHVGHIDQMVRDAFPFRRRWFSSTDVESAIDLHRIDRDNFATESFGQADRYGRFANRSGTGQEEGRNSLRHGRSLRTGWSWHLVRIGALLRLTH